MKFSTAKKKKKKQKKKNTKQKMKNRKQRKTHTNGTVSHAPLIYSVHLSVKAVNQCVGDTAVRSSVAQQRILSCSRKLKLLCTTNTVCSWPTVVFA